MAKTTPSKDGKNAKGTSPGLPLFYKSPMPLDAKRHEKLALRKNFGLGFTKEVNAVPINLIEMPQICHFYPIAFSPDDQATPVAILGLRDHENLFLKEDGRWEESYIPAYIRRYPFIFSEIPGKDQLTLCIDNVPEILEEGGNQRFFDKEGKASALATNALEFCKSYHTAAQQTLEFGKALAKSGLLIEREAQINVAGNRRIKFSGFKIVDEQKLAGLSDKVFLEWRAKGWLPFIYAHLFSGAQWQRLTHLLNQRIDKEAA
ncbi:MAG: SapC family protein [Alphaproteobacteria bacterium]|nr:SapC family protein [Alphaproteobacteria bacterium]